MMFLDQDFALKNDFAKILYHDYAEKMPIIDYHCHLDPKEIYENGKFENITQAWLGGDHYKWRLMRANGVPEELVTGDGDDYEKFIAWAKTLEGCIGNPLYVWTNLELKRIFGIEELLTEKNAPIIWEKANKKLQDDSMSTREIIKNFHVKVICTTDDPASDLHYHELIAKDETAFNVFPTFRPDKAFAINTDNFAKNVEELADVSGVPVHTYEDFTKALAQRVDYFHAHGGRLSDHGFLTFHYATATPAELETIFAKGLANEPLTETEQSAYQFELIVRLMGFYHDHDWTAQFHLQATRNNNGKLMAEYGADGGGDAIADDFLEAAVSRLLDRLVTTDKLPKTILYSLNPKDYIPLVALVGSFQGQEKGKIQFGAAWWFNDTLSGMRYQLTNLAEGGILGNFVGMLTDSRSFLSYPRHEYFRRVLCQLVSEWAEDDQMPNDPSIIGPLMEKIAYTNAAEYFGFKLPAE